MTWMVQVVGDSSDLRGLANKFQSSVLKVTKESDGYYLWSSRFEDTMTLREIAAEAESLLSLLTGILATTNGSSRRFTQGAAVRVNPDGTRDYFVSIVETLHARMDVGMDVRDDNGGVVSVRGSNNEQRLLHLALKDSAVEKVMRLLGVEAADWVGLYRIYEVIESDVGGVSQLLSNGWTTNRKINSFKHTANSPGAVGDLARHGSEDTQPPAKPMKFEEASELITQIFHAWIATKK